MPSKTELSMRVFCSSRPSEETGTSTTCLRSKELRSSREKGPVLVSRSFETEEQQHVI